MDILLKRLLVHYPHLELETLNAGVGGIMLPHLLQRLQGCLDDFKPTWAVLFMGQNDAKKYGPERFESNLVKVLEVLRNARVSTLQLSTTPHPGEARKNGVLAQYDRIIERRCREFGNRFVDVKTPFEKLLGLQCRRRTPGQGFRRRMPPGGAGKPASGRSRIRGHDQPGSTLTAR